MISWVEHEINFITSGPEAWAKHKLWKLSKAQADKYEHDISTGPIYVRPKGKASLVHNDYFENCLQLAA